MPVLTYTGFIIGLMSYINVANKISFQSLNRQAKSNDKAAKLLVMSRLGSKVGWVAGVGGGACGLLYGLYASGRFGQLW